MPVGFFVVLSLSCSRFSLPDLFSAFSSQALPTPPHCFASPWDPGLVVPGKDQLSQGRWVSDPDRTQGQGIIPTNDHWPNSFRADSPRQGPSCPGGNQLAQWVPQFHKPTSSLSRSAVPPPPAHCFASPWDPGLVVPGKDQLSQGRWVSDPDRTQGREIIPTNDHWPNSFRADSPRQGPSCPGGNQLAQWVPQFHKPTSSLSRSTVPPPLPIALLPLGFSGLEVPAGPGWQCESGHT